MLRDSHHNSSRFSLSTKFSMSAVYTRLSILVVLLLLGYVAPGYTEESEEKPHCYEELGCFKAKSPWLGWTRPVPSPQTPQKINTTFFFSDRNTDRAVVPTWPTVKIPTRFDSRKPTYFLTHGFSSTSEAEWFRNLTKAILQVKDANVFAVDWTKGSSVNYLQAVGNTRIVGAETARVIRNLQEQASANVTTFHLMGHSLGAHIMGYAGKNVTDIGQITGLDPAKPGFQGQNPAVRLHNGDAKFIDIVHTDGKPLLGLGMSVSVGDVDFFVNGGASQPNCLLDGKPLTIKSILDVAEVTIDVIYNLATCAHSRAARYMAQAIRGPCKMWGHRYKALYARYTYTDFVLGKSCSRQTCNRMGLDTIKYPARGNFAVKTSGKYPFCIREEKVDAKMG